MRRHIEQHWIPVLLQQPSGLVLLHGRDINDRNRFSKTLNYTAAVIDGEAYGNLPHYEEAAIPRGLSLNWIRINPDIYTFLIDRKSSQPAGYVNAMPVDDISYAAIRCGNLVDNTISADNVVSYQGKDTVKIYLMSIAIAEKYRRWGEGLLQNAYVQLLTGFLDKLIWYAKRYNVRATHFLATAWTAEGRQICNHFAMTEVGKDSFGNSIFELDLDALRFSSTAKVFPGLRRLLKAYAELGS
jgi:hypothetical protein